MLVDLSINEWIMHRRSAHASWHHSFTQQSFALRLVTSALCPLLLRALFMLQEPRACKTTSSLTPSINWIRHLSPQPSALTDTTALPSICVYITHVYVGVCQRAPPWRCRRLHRPWLSEPRPVSSSRGLTAAHRDKIGNRPDKEAPGRGKAGQRWPRHGRGNVNQPEVGLTRGLEAFWLQVSVVW